MKILRLLILGTNIFCGINAGWANDIVISERMHHIRINGEREWSEFPEDPEASDLDISFYAEVNQSEWTLQLRQYDVKQRWSVAINNVQIGHLLPDENDMIIYLSVPAGIMIKGSNVLRIHQEVRSPSRPDDVKIGEFILKQKPMLEVMSVGRVEIEIRDVDSRQPLPARVTILNKEGVLQSIAADSNVHLAVRPGCICSSTGRMSFGIPAGTYTIFAGRGFEYSLDRKEISVSEGSSEFHLLQIRREVPTEGYICSDTHIHTLTHSGHGDASVEERMVTLAAEGIELPIATDHNKHIDYTLFAKRVGVLPYFTPVIGNEVSTSLGHFNIFPIQPEAHIPDCKLGNWQEIFADIYHTPKVKVVILNHPRDVHSGVTPFGPSLFNHVVGENLENWSMNFNAMEVINSGATQTDILLLFRDWMALLNRGYQVTPIGSSDSHDVSRFFVGQGRTYIRGDDRDPGNLDIDAATNSMVHGQVMVSYGLLAEMVVEDKYQSGDVVRMPDDLIDISVRVLGPHWTSANTLQLYANGNLLQTVKIENDSLLENPMGVKWSGNLQIQRPNHDVHLVAIALGPGIDGSFWKTAKPYQPASPDWEAKVLGCSGAIWIDVDGDGRGTPAYEYASRIFAEAEGNLAGIVAKLSDYDRAVAAQAANLWKKSGGAWNQKVEEVLQSASESVRNGFAAFKMADEECQSNRAE